MNAGLQYHYRELALALDVSHPAHSLPIIPPSAKRILDLGCGMGQTLVALRLAPDIEAWGVDKDTAALDAGSKLVGNNIHLTVGVGEKLPFPDQNFDLVFSRVALPYMNLPATLAEVSRVLRPGGMFWAALHPPRMLVRRMREDFLAGNLRDFTFCGFVALNSVFLRCFGRQFQVRGHCETVQTRAGFRNLLAASGLEYLPNSRPSNQLIVEGRKPS